MKIICIGRNYVAHAHELGNDVPTQPLVFMKPSSALLVGNKPLYYPDFSNEIQYELEVVLKIGKNGKSIQTEDALSYIEAIALGIDFTARDVQADLKEKGHPWEIAKAWDGSAVMSPFVDAKPYLKDPIRYRLELNGNTVQKGDTSLMIFNFVDIISYVSQFFKLQVGDYIFTGTPSGVGPISRGDVLTGYLSTPEGEQTMMECEIK